MALLNESINANDLPESSGGFDPLPPGDYQARIADADVKKTKDGSGEYIKVRLDIIGPTHAGRVVFANFNIRNKSPKAEEIGRQQLGGLMRAIGLPTLTDTDQLVGGNVTVSLKIRDDEKYGPSNEVKAFRSIGGSQLPAASAPPAAASAPAKPAANTPPWARK